MPIQPNIYFGRNSGAFYLHVKSYPKMTFQDLVSMDVQMGIWYVKTVLTLLKNVCNEVCAAGQPEFFLERDHGILAGANFMVVVHFYYYTSIFTTNLL